MGERTLRQPIRALTLTLERWRQGDATVRTGASPFTGEIGMLGHSLDEMMDEITRRQQDRELLFNELDHRVKNTLATVQAIAISTFNTPERGKAAVPEFSARIVALGKAHDVLTREKWEGAHLREIAVRVMEPVTGRAGVRCSIEGPDVFLEPRQALAFTMVLHELCTNAVKYGALSQPSGTVRVSWDLGPESIRPSLALTWKEHDGPPVMTPERTGFGSRLIRQGFARELGDVALDFEPDGVRCVIRTVVEPTGAETIGSDTSGELTVASHPGGRYALARQQGLIDHACGDLEVVDPLRSFAGGCAAHGRLQRFLAPTRWRTIRPHPSISSGDCTQELRPAHPLRP